MDIVIEYNENAPADRTLIYNAANPILPRVPLQNVEGQSKW